MLSVNRPLFSLCGLSLQLFQRQHFRFLWDSRSYFELVAEVNTRSLASSLFTLEVMGLPHMSWVTCFCAILSATDFRCLCMLFIAWNTIEFGKVPFLTCYTHEEAVCIFANLVSWVVSCLPGDLAFGSICKALYDIHTCMEFYWYVSLILNICGVTRHEKTLLMKSLAQYSCA